jgi:hypothetical protein
LVLPKPDYDSGRVIVEVHPSPETLPDPPKLCLHHNLNTTNVLVNVDYQDSTIVTVPYCGITDNARSPHQWWLFDNDIYIKTTLRNNNFATCRVRIWKIETLTSLDSKTLTLLKANSQTLNSVKP